MRQLFVLLLLVSSAVAQAAPVRQIDPASTLTVYAYKTGLLAFAAHDHVIRAPIVSGEVVLAEGSQRAKLVIDARGMQVLDPKLDADKRAEVQATMHSAKVLDTGTYPQIVFRSTAVRRLDSIRWEVAGVLTLHGETRPLTLTVAEQDGAFSGEARFKQTAFGITPVSVAGGSIKVKDEVKIEFTIRLQP